MIWDFILSMICFFVFQCFFSNPVARIVDGLFFEGGIQNRFLFGTCFFLLSGMFFL